MNTNEEIKLSNRIVWIDLIKVIAIFSVILLHSAASIVTQMPKIDMNIWHIGNIYDSMSRMAVPLFFMVTGALLLQQKDESLRLFFSKRFTKVIIPLIGWSVIYILFRKYILHQDINILHHILESFYQRQFFHLWFLYTIIGLYLFIPIFKVFVQNSSQILQLYFIGLWITTVSIIPLINKFTPIHIPNYLPMLSGYVGFLLLGFLLYHFKITKKIFIISLIILIISTLTTILGTYFLSIHANKFQGFFYNNFTLTTVMQSISSFIILKYIGTRLVYRPKKLQPIIMQISFASFGIYLIHPIFLHIIKHNYIHLNQLHALNAIYMVPLLTSLVFFLSFISIYIMQKIPFIKKIIP